MWLRGCIIWLGAALIGSVGGTLIWLRPQLPWNNQDVTGARMFVEITLFFTVPGSAFLALIYSQLEERSLPHWLSLVRSSPLAASRDFLCFAFRPTSPR